MSKRQDDFRSDAELTTWFEKTAERPGKPSVWPAARPDATVDPFPLRLPCSLSSHGPLVLGRCYEIVSPPGYVGVLSPSTLGSDPIWKYDVIS